MTLDRVKTKCQSFIRVRLIKKDIKTYFSIIGKLSASEPQIALFMF